MFCVISTSEGPNNCVSISAVPRSWVKGNALYWPPGNKGHVLKMMKEKKQPASTWKKIACKIKLDDVESLEKANKIADAFSNLSDTDSEHRFLTSSSQISKEIDFNDMVSQVLNTDDSSNSNHIDSSPTHDMLVPENNCIEELKNRLQSLEIQMLDMSAKLNVKLDKILDVLKRSTQDVVPCRDKIQDISFPLTTHEEIVELNKKLLDNEVKSQLTEKLTEFGGKAGTANGMKIAFKLSGYVFETQLLTHYSWTGTTRHKAASEKYAFQKFENIVDLFFDIIHMADSKFTKQDNENFFKLKVLKHSKQRLNRLNLK